MAPPGRSRWLIPPAALSIHRWFPDRPALSAGITNALIRPVTEKFHEPAAATTTPTGAQV
ncbi:hypothetical protein [Pseudonocardia sp.]|uniref:hypothetical protein n=1 Tax=Pseudonocardia sp. TaxID=60912 RepID=UPI0026018116|nr:hypothetical protein [Pseudonocardia sp.]